MTHLVWCPPEWRAQARATLAGLLERHPARTIFLIPDPGGRGRDQDARRAEGLRAAGPLARGALRGDRAPARAHGDAPSRARSCCRCSSPTCPSSAAGAASPAGRPGARGDRRRRRPARRRLVGVARSRPRLRAPRAALFAHGSPSPTSPTRAPLPVARAGSPSCGRAIGSIERLRVEGPRADAELLAGWLRSRLRARGDADPAQRRGDHGGAGRRRAGRVPGRDRRARASSSRPSSTSSAATRSTRDRCARCSGCRPSGATGAWTALARLE